MRLVGARRVNYRGLCHVTSRRECRSAGGITLPDLDEISSRSYRQFVKPNETVSRSDHFCGYTVRDYYLLGSCFLCGESRDPAVPPREARPHLGGRSLFPPRSPASLLHRPQGRVIRIRFVRSKDLNLLSLRGDKMQDFLNAIRRRHTRMRISERSSLRSFSRFLFS